MVLISVPFTVKGGIRLPKGLDEFVVVVVFCLFAFFFVEPGIPYKQTG